MNRLISLAIFVMLIAGCGDNAANTSRANAIAPFKKANEIRAGRQEEAIALYTKAIEADPLFAEAYFNRGLSYAEMYDFERAEADLAKVKHPGIDSKKLEEAIVIAKKLEKMSRKDTGR